MRLAVYTDYTYHRDVDGVSGERAFVRFMTALAPHVDRLTLVGRMHPDSGRSHYPIDPEIGVVGLPYYASLAHPRAALVSLWQSGRRFWRLLDDVDTVWLLGPYVHAFLFAALARLRGRSVILGVRQDFPAYVRSRRPDRRWMHAAADVLEGAFRALARRLPIAVVGPELAHNYRRSPRLLELTVSLISDAEVADTAAGSRADDGPVRVLSVGRLDREKNPLLLAETLQRLRAAGGAWWLDVVGDGPMAADLAAELEARGQASAACLHGYVPIDAGLRELYRTADLFLHVSWTEGLPQVLFEAFAAGLPVVATDVGGVRAAAGDAAILIPPGDAAAAAAAVTAVAADPGERARLVDAGFARARAHTIEQETARLVGFLRDA